jgi:hypothetical protein
MMSPTMRCPGCSAVSTRTVHLATHGGSGDLARWWTRGRWHDDGGVAEEDRSSVHAFRDALLAAGPGPADRDTLQLFGQFVGSWDLTVTDVLPDGTTRTTAGEWHFGWLLGGRAVGDVWIYPARSVSAVAEEHGLSVRFPDPAVGGWRSTWVGPRRRLVRQFVARQVGTEIVLAGHNDDGDDLQWVFSEITPTSFRWRNQVGGRTGWRVVQTFQAERRPAP